MKCRLCKGEHMNTSDEYTTYHLDGTCLVIEEDFKQGEPYRTYIDLNHCPECGRRLI